MQVNPKMWDLWNSFGNEDPVAFGPPSSANYSLLSFTPISEKSFQVPSKRDNVQCVPWWCGVQKHISRPLLTTGPTDFGASCLPYSSFEFP
eukprot:2257861-Amphidinium_carterae.1